MLGLLGNLSEIKARRIKVAASKFDIAPQRLFGITDGIDLQREYPYRIENLRIVRIGRKQAAELGPCILIALLANQGTGITEARLLRSGIGGQP